MMYANNKNGIKIEPSPKITGVCRNCNQAVVSKCGAINIWHFAHVSLKDCDTWSEGETEWHRKWKEFFPEHEREVIIQPHRADVVHKGTVIEFQSKALDYYSMQEREEFYGNMIWITKSDATKFSVEWREKNGKQYFAFRWKWCSQTWKNATKQIYVDLGNNLIFKIWKIYDNNFGAGEFISK